ncbi:MAG: MBL fold metallo-hydrolase [bacterium]|nr:MBL fold metallo-hydrolase [bacterium]MCX7916701.1 MBL fold metallo-hydrolase [bacterium]MDW8163575.1 MBL fold metallo-hydrolase [Candidatus Omnitrophota bacterium]
MVEYIRWLGHASILITIGGKNIYIDPWKLIKDQPKGDLILITHSHYDHFSPDDINKVIKNDSVIIGPHDILKIKLGEKIEIKPGQEVNLNWCKVRAIPAYNVNKNFHPKSNNWCGYIIEIEGKKIYIAGDTDFVPEMKEIKVDVAIVPIGGTYTMTAEEAANAINTIKPQIAIPYHYGDIVGSDKDVKLFSSFVLNSKVEILKIER